MGIPKFFRWMSERYPGLLTTARDEQLPEIDNFYLDMNGIIHNCTHPNDGDVHFRISEEQMFDDIFSYVCNLFRIIRPRKIFFLAVDGVAPRAKMNQQRGRRFRSAKEAMDREEAALAKGHKLPDEQRFDSNCITPGTDFMVKLHRELQKFIQVRLATDPEWRNVKIVLSGHETPGEGEHKVMDFIRYQRSQPDYDRDTKHCLYGLDTDLIMLGLSLHEPSFMLLREEMKFTGKKNDATRGKSQRVDASKVNFNVLYLEQLRDYIENDFLQLKPSLKFKFDLEAIIDDWILICFLVGNDFIPHIPHFHIHKSALPKIFDVYQKILPTLDGHLNEKGIINLERFRKFAKALAAVDFENYKNLLKENGGKCAKDDFSKLNEFVRQKMRIHGISNPSNGNHYRRQSSRPNNQLTHHSNHHRSDVWYNIQRRSVQTGPKQSPNQGRPQNDAPSNGRVGVHNFTEEQINNSITVCADGDILDSSEDDVDDFGAYKQTYYREKLKLEPDKRSILTVVNEYMRALQWTLHYYYHGCVSWGWYYPYHYAPFISDIANFTAVDFKFEMGEPFKPFDQLLSVLPAASSSLLPKLYRPLVTSADSPLAKYFPTEVDYDLNGKQNDWEAVVLAPFIDEDVLLKASILCNLFLPQEDRARNSHGPHFIYEFVETKKGPSQRGARPGVAAGMVKCSEVASDGFFVPRNKIRYGLLKQPNKNKEFNSGMMHNHDFKGGSNGRSNYASNSMNYGEIDQEQSRDHQRSNNKNNQNHRYPNNRVQQNFNSSNGSSNAQHRDAKEPLRDGKTQGRQNHYQNRESRGARAGNNHHANPNNRTLSNKVARRQ